MTIRVEPVDNNYFNIFCPYGHTYIIRGEDLGVKKQEVDKHLQQLIWDDPVQIRPALPALKVVCKICTSPPYRIPGIPADILAGLAAIIPQYPAAPRAPQQYIPDLAETVVPTWETLGTPRPRARTRATNRINEVEDTT